MRARLIKSGQYTEYKNALYKHRLSLPSQLNNGGQPFIDYSDDFYLANCSIGTPPQYSTLVMDTGSSNLWVIDAKCKSTYCKGGLGGSPAKHQFDTTKSSTYKGETTTFSITYGSGSCNGHLAKDTFDFGGLEVQQQEFGVASTIAEVFGYQPVDGICGLGWPALAVDNVEPPINNIVKNLDQPGFHVFITRHTTAIDNGNSDGGMITYGAYDTKNCAPLTAQNFVPLTAETYWQFKLDGYTIGTSKGTTAQQAISDTGTSWIGAPAAVMTAVEKITKARHDTQNDLYYVPCNEMATLPDFVVTIGGVQYPIKSTEYVLDLGLGAQECPITFFSMAGLGVSGPQWILGDTFIRAYCNYYDIGGKQIGFSKSTQP